MLLATVNSGTLIIALPDLERALHTSILSLVWVILAYMIASTVLVLTAGRLSDLFGRKRAYVGGFVLFAARLARRGLRLRRHGADPVADRCRAIAAAFLFANSVRARHRRVSARAARAGDGHQHHGRRRSGWCSARCSAARSSSISWHWVFWFNVPLDRARRRSGRALVLRELAKPDEVRGLDPLGTLTFVVGLTGLVLGVSRGGISGWNDPLVTVGASLIAGACCCRCSCSRAPQPAPMLDLVDLPQPPVRGRHGRGVHQRALALRADVRVRLLLPGRARATTRSRPASSSPRWRSAC